GDHPVPGLQQRRDLPVPGAAADRVPVDQHHRLAGAVVLVMDLDVAGIFPADGDLGHQAFLSGRRPLLVFGAVSLPAGAPGQRGGKYSYRYSLSTAYLPRYCRDGWPARESSSAARTVWL